MFILGSVCVEKNYIDIQGKLRICTQCVLGEEGDLFKQAVQIALRKDERAYGGGLEGWGWW